jgi:phospholipid/cholesterol/gamma-HCH transport system substrate-binding protein
MPFRVSIEVKIGIFVLIALIILFVGILSIGDFYYISRPGYEISILFDFTGGVEVGAPVKMSGIKVGEVRDIKLFYDEARVYAIEGRSYTGQKKVRAEVSAWIEGDIQIPQDSIAYVESMGLLGDRYIEITPGSDFEHFLKKGGMLIGETPISMEALSGDLQRLTQSLNEIVDRLKRGEGTLGKLLYEEELYNNFRDLSRDIKRHPWKLLWKTREKTREKKSKLNKQRVPEAGSGEGNRGYLQKR